MSQTVLRMEKELKKKVQLNYLLHLPDGYEKGSPKKWPLILFLHGAGECGDDIELVKIHGIPKIVEQKPDFPFVAVSPQCPADSSWNVEQDAVMALVDEITAHHNVDSKRIYLTGLSMGGYGTWHLAAEYPGRFAAIAPICGGGNPKRINELKGTPVWVFHGAKDNVVPLAKSEEMVSTLRANGGDVKFTVYPDLKHNSWTTTYDNPELYAWFLSHSI
ncbi:prolyl oligopeptidase family serine peptidase [Paenibacillus sp. OSY-SE]|uniref:carboxylesterase family protein n=1 Tax=Paenibacillus sp. OSY-SE TaxID=1196323 RepID=UPI00031F0746|nr:prolyl oligopeptidase family serine peptidase [Paenibacillus sp. OSY-SE]